MYLDDIVKHKRKEVKDLKLADMDREKKVLDAASFIKKSPFIAEIKKASPSMGTINSTVDISKQALLYEKGGAGAISVLTDEKYFRGSFDFLHQVSRTVSIPLLCKDFIIDEIQIENAFRHGADFILLIAAILSSDELKRLTGKAQELNLQVLYELHDLDEFSKIANLEPVLVGVNSRNLNTFKIDKEHARSVISKLQGNFLKIAESGINNEKDITAYRNAGADAFLIGTALMKSNDPVTILKQFYSAMV